MRYNKNQIESVHYVRVGDRKSNRQVKRKCIIVAVVAVITLMFFFRLSVAVAAATVSQVLEKRCIEYFVSLRIACLQPMVQRRKSNVSRVLI
jgi:hypothetical protein